MAGRRSALIVATQRYADPGLSALAATDADAQALTDVLGNPEIGDFDVTTLVDASAFEIGKAVAQFFSNRRTDDLLLLHFSCHGVKDDSGELYFAATDTQIDLLDGTGVASSFVNRVMNRSRAGRVLLTLDCCYAGAFGRGLTSRAAGTVDLGDRLGGRGRAVIAASSALQFAFEGQRPDGGGLGSPSLFTHALVEGLRSGDADRDLDGQVSLDELYAYIHDEVTRVNPDQTPKKWALDIEGDLYVARRALPVTTPSELPEVLRRTMGSLVPYERVSVMEPLRELALGAHPGLALAARLALQRSVSHDDSAQVRRAASRALTALGPAAAPTTPPRPLATPPVVPAPRPGSPPLEITPADPSPPSLSRPPAAREGRRRLVLVAVVVASAVAAGLAWRLWPSGSEDPPPAPGPPAVDPLPGGELLITRYSESGEFRLLRVDVAQRRTELVSGFPERVAQPSLDPSRTRLAFVAGSFRDAGRVPYLSAVDGSGQSRMLSGENRARCPLTGRPAWSSDGERLAFVCYGNAGRSSSRGVFSLDIAAGQMDMLDASSGDDGPVSWTRSGGVVFARHGPNGTGLLRVTPGERAQVLTDGDGRFDGEPTWTPTGVLFTRSAADRTPGQLTALTADGASRQLDLGDDVWWPALSPDGSMVAYLRGESTEITLWVVDRARDGTLSRPREIPVDGEGVLGPPAWGTA